MLLYEPDRKSDFSELSTRTTATSVANTQRFVLYDPEEIPKSSRPTIGSHGIEIKENGSVVTYYTDKHVLEDPYDAQGIRLGAWEIGICDVHAWLPMTCCILCAVPSIALAQMRTRLGLARYGPALVKEFLRLLLLVGLPVVGYVALLKLQGLPEEASSPSPLVTTMLPPISPRRTGPATATTTEPVDAQATPWMLLLWTAFLSVVLLLLTVALAVHDLRFKIRTRYQIPGSHERDVCVVVCLPTCAIAQMSMHLRCLRPGRYSLACPETLPPYEY